MEHSMGFTLSSLVFTEILKHHLLKAILFSVTWHDPLYKLIIVLSLVAGSVSKYPL